MSRTEPIPTDDVAIELWGALIKSPDGLAIWEMQKLHPHLTKSQIRVGINRINQVMQLTREQPLICEPTRGRSVVYRFPLHAPDYRAFALRRLRELLTRAHTELTRAESAVLRWPDDLAPYLPKMLRRVGEDLADVLRDIAEAVD